jgi:hypothetical protein
MAQGLAQRYANVHDAAAYLGITESALRCRIGRGQVPYIKEDSGRLVFDFYELDRYLSQRARPGTRSRLPTGVTHHGEEEK